MALKVAAGMLVAVAFVAVVVALDPLFKRYRVPSALPALYFACSPVR
jgi:hypothetical protein